MMNVERPGRKLLVLAEPEGLSDEPVLTAEKMQQIFPVARSDRRGNHEIFAEFVAPEHRKDGCTELKDDEVFYDALLRMASGEGLAEMIRFDKIMIGRNHRRKSFVSRASSYLLSEMPDLTPEDIFESSEEHFPPGSVSQAVLSFLRRLDQAAQSLDQAAQTSGGGSASADVLEILTGDPPAEAADSGAQSANASAPEGWVAIREQMVAEIAAFDHADANAAARLRDLAEDLVRACEIAEENEVEKARIDALRAWAVELVSIREDDWPASASAAWLEDCEQAMDELEVAGRELLTARAEQERLNLEARNAFETEDFAAEERLFEPRRSARVRVTEMSAAVGVARERLQALFGPTGAEEGAAEGGDAGAAVPDRQDLADGSELVPDPVAADRKPGGAVEAADANARTVTPVPAADAGSSELVEEVPTDKEPAGLDEIAAQEETAAEDSGVVEVAKALATSALSRGERQQIRRAADHHPVAMPLDAAAPSDFKEPSPRPSLDDCSGQMAGYIQRGDLALACHLATLVEEQGLIAPVPSALLEAAVVLPAVRRPADLAESDGMGIVASVIPALETAPDRPAAELIALAGLLRAALFDPYSARFQVANLPTGGVLAPYAEVVGILGGLSHGVQPTIGDIAELAGARTRTPQQAAEEALRDWLLGVRQRKSAYQPSTVILHAELRSDGLLGAVIEGVLAGRPGARDAAQDYVERLSGDRSAQDDYMADLEDKMGRRSSRRIEGMALGWFRDRVQEACELLQDWIEAAEAQPEDSNKGRETLRREIGALKKALETALSRDLQVDGVLAEAAAAALGAEARSFLSLLEGQGVTRSRRPADALARSLLRLPAGSQDWTDGNPALEAERASARERRLAALLDPSVVAPDWKTALKGRMAEQAALSTRELLTILHEDSDEEQVERDTQMVEELIQETVRPAKERVERLRQSLSTLSFLDIEATESLSADMARLASISAAIGADREAGGVSLPAVGGLRAVGVPPDFPELFALLDEMGAARDARQQGIRTNQRRELEGLRGNRGGGSADVLLEHLESLDPVTVDDAIAELRAGRDVVLGETAGPDAFTRFFPDFVAAIDLASDETTIRNILSEALPRRGTAGPIDFSTHDAAGVQRVRQLIETWSAVRNSMQSGKTENLRSNLAMLFGQIGFTSTRVPSLTEPLPGRMRSGELRCDVPRPTSWFLPPPFGSGAQGRYRLMVVRAEVHFDQVLRQIASDAPDAAWLCVFLGRVNETARRKLARDARRDARQLLVLDETLLLHLAAEQGDPLEVFFACTSPFSWVQPYSTNAGQIPPEVFFGRREEMARILRRGSGGCLIYGGRQLGKSALLYHIRRERHRPDQGEIAVHLDIKPIGGSNTPADRIWVEFAHELENSGFGKPLGRTGAEIVSAIRVWLDADPARRMTAMFDEADNFLSAEHAGGYANLQRLKSLMEATDWRFKAVFAGLHSVRRLAQAPNSPLPHLGDPVCIGPMNQTLENRNELRRLATEPLKAAGFDYADPSLAIDMLARMNYYPSLVQVFGHQIVESHGSRIPVRRDGPRWLLQREHLFEGETAERIAAQIRARFQLTLNLDPRYEVIAKSIALARFDLQGGEAAVLSRGLTVAEVEKTLHWPAWLAKLSRLDLEEMLSEMVDLGVLGRHSGGYGLRNAQVAQMLGSRDRLEDELLHLEFSEADPVYDAAIYHGLLRPSRPQDRSPLPERTLARLFDKDTHGLRCVVGRAEIVGSEIAARLVAAARNQPEFKQAEACNADDRALGNLLERKTRGPRVIVIDGPWRAETARLLSGRPQVLKGEVIPIWCLPEMPEGELAVEAVLAGAWSEGMLRHWLAEEGIAGSFDEARLRTVIMEATGGAPARLMELRSLLGEILSLDHDAKSDRIAAWATARPFRPEALGLDGAALDALKLLGEFEGAVDSLSELEAIHADLPERLPGLVAAGCLVAGEAGSMPRLSPLGRLLL